MQRWKGADDVNPRHVMSRSCLVGADAKPIHLRGRRREPANHYPYASQPSAVGEELYLPGGSRRPRRQHRPAHDGRFVAFCRLGRRPGDPIACGSSSLPWAVAQSGDPSCRRPFSTHATSRAGTFRLLGRLIARDAAGAVLVAEGDHGATRPRGKGREPCASEGARRSTT